MIYGYLRVSSDEQDVNSQKQGVDEFALKKGWIIDGYIKDEGVSGAKDPSKRALGGLLKTIKSEDAIIVSELSRLGRDLYMVMEILHHCTKTGCKVYGVKDGYELSDNIQSKVLSFAFGLAAEIERQMIRQRTKEGLKLRRSMGILLGRPIGRENLTYKLDPHKDDIKYQYEIGVPVKRLAVNFKCDRTTMANYIKRLYAPSKNSKTTISHRLQIVDDFPYDIVKAMIEQEGLTIPEIYKKLLSTHNYTYDQVYDNIFVDKPTHLMYRRIVQPRIKRRKD